MTGKEIIETLDDILKNRTIIKGIADIVKNEFGDYSVINNDYWVIAGYISDEQIKKQFSYCEFTKKDNVDKEGVYEYDAIIYYQCSTYDEPSETYIDYIDLRFIETFQERDREEKLNKLLFEDFDFL